MLFDISKFLFIYFLVLFAFANGLNQLYYNYGNNGTVTTNSPHAIIPSQASIYIVLPPENLKSTLEQEIMDG